MDNTILFAIISVVVVAGIIWIVIYSGKRTRKHLAQTSIRVRILDRGRKRLNVPEGFANMTILR